LECNAFGVKAKPDERQSDLRTLIRESVISFVAAMPRQVIPIA
jgi:hypothetical protein